MDHPRQGRTQLFRRNIDVAGLKAILQNARVHTGAGYHKRSSGKKRARTERPGGAAALPSRRHRSSSTTTYDEDGGGGGGDADEGGEEDAGPDPLDEETEAMAQLVRLKAAAKEVADQIAQAEAAIAVFTQKKAAEAKQAIEAK